MVSGSTTWKAGTRDGESKKGGVLLVVCLFFCLFVTALVCVDIIKCVYEIYVS